MGTESIPMRSIAAPPAPVNDPYYYGWRMVPRWDDRGGQTWEKVPLTPWDVLHPEEEDFIVNNDAHDRDIHYLKDVFEEQIAGRESTRVLCDHRVMWGIPDLGAHGPDVVVFENLNKPWDPLRATFPVQEMGARPVLIVEVTSPSTRDGDLDEKVEEYHIAGVPLYVIADRRETEDGRTYVRIMGYRATPEGYVRIPEQTNGIWIESLKVWIQAEGDRVVCADEHGRRIPDLRDQRDAERQRADAAESQHDAERARADDNARKLAELEAALRRLRGE